MGRYSMPALFTFLTGVFLVIAYAAGDHRRWIIAVAAAALGAWMSSFAWSALRKTRR